MFGIPIAAEDSDIAHIDVGFKLLTSKDPVVQMLAWEELTETENHRHQSTRFENIQDFLNTAPSQTNSNKYKSQWSMARLASERFKIKWEVQQDKRIGLCAGEDILEDRSAVFRNIRKHLRNQRTLSLRGHPNYSTLYKKQHDAVVSRVKTAALNRWEVMTENQVIGSGKLKPDLVLKKGEDVPILDVVIPFENGLEALTDARVRKEVKYQVIAEELGIKGFNAKVEAIVVGSLGSWVPANDKAMKRICSKKYLNSCKKLLLAK